jgi:rubrerythrin
MSKTIENLQNAFAGESQANRRYLAFARKAEEEGKVNLGRLFRAVAEGETVHALQHLATAGGVMSSRENLEKAINGESYEIESMYPQFIHEAEKDDEKMAMISFATAKRVEAVHQRLFQDAMPNVLAGEDVKHEIYHVCQVCGNLFAGEVPDNCTICNAPKNRFDFIE